MDSRINSDLEQWIAQLPVAEAEVGDGFVLTGWLVSSEPDQIRIVIGELCLSFSRGDILDQAPVGATEHVGMSPTGAIRIAVRRGAPLLDARLGLLIDESSARRPFALSTRPLRLMLEPAPRFRELERQFLLSQSLTGA